MQKKIESALTQMEQWSILSNVINYIQFDKHPKIIITLNISAVNKEKCRRNSYIKEEERQTRTKFWTPHKLKEEYLDVYEGIQTEMLSTIRFNENSDLSTTYLVKEDKSKSNKIKAEESFPISEQGHTMKKLLNGTECQILLDMGTSKSFMSKSQFLGYKSLNSLPKFTSNTQRIQVGNGQFVSVLFIIPIIVDIHGHRFEVYTLVSEIHENIALVLGIKNIFELKGIIDS